MESTTTWLVDEDGELRIRPRGANLPVEQAAAREWILGWLTPLLDDVQPDYLKWDNNMWVNCTREGHEHGANDGNFAQVNGAVRSSRRRCATGTRIC